MKKTLKINKEKLTDEPLDKTKSFFNSHGFKIYQEGPYSLTFQKGSTLKNMFTFNPLEWKTDVNIEINESSFQVEFEINTIGQLVTSKEDDLWEKFIDNFNNYIQNNSNYTNLNNEIRATKLTSLKYVGWALVGALIVGVPASIVAYITDINPIGSTVIASVTGAMSFLIDKINKDKRKKEL
ncbi:hypothetical protein [Flexithrix dorotheae]|uniref:hypothetical protein n=1 Tax=Flexithrix dorotheae TaxID=70993 RepID=UPI00037CA82D|nr:hypothetical protein [Flexithrix dorotheae]